MPELSIPVIINADTETALQVIGMLYGASYTSGNAKLKEAMSDLLDQVTGYTVKNGILTQREVLGMRDMIDRKIEATISGN